MTRSDQVERTLVERRVAKQDAISKTRNGTVISVVHFGDLHITNEDEQNYRDFKAIVREVNAHLAGQVDFAVLPGDNAEDGAAEQFALVKNIIDDLKVPLKILPGDHDRKQGNLDAYYSVLRAEILPNALIAGRYRSLFLDVVSAGKGGPDFRLGESQMVWLRDQLQDAEAAGEKTIAFMHCYPEDFKEGAEAVSALFSKPTVIAVDTGHTHYNELVNRDRTIYAATRSTGQIEEGPAGFSILAADGDVVSWRFKPLESGWPFVVITSPSDRQLVVNSSSPDQVVTGPTRVRALVFGAERPTKVECRIDEGDWRPMAPVSATSLWEAQVEQLAQAFDLTVRATAPTSQCDEETISVATRADELHRDDIGEWKAKHILGTQLGPNKNGRKW